jgi:CHAD domain-containing protein
LVETLDPASTGDIYCTVRLKPKESLNQGFRRLVVSQTAALVSNLADAATEPAQRVHDARRRLKRLRALLHLVHEAIAPSNAKEIYREISRQLSDVRDTEVALQTFERLVAGDPQETWKAQRSQLNAILKRRERLALSSDRLATMAAILRKQSQTLASLAFPGKSWDIVTPEVCRTYRKAYKLRELNTTDAKEIHRLRKLNKRLTLQLEILKCAIPKKISQPLRHAKRLDDLLGQHHDLHVLNALLLSSPKRSKIPGIKLLQQRIMEETEHVLKKARKVSGKVYHLSKREFAKAL